MRTWIGAALILFVADFFLKAHALQRLPEEGGRLRSPIDFALHKNYGIAFDIPVPLWAIILITIVVVGVCVRALMLSKKDPSVAVPLVFIVLGAVGNLVDRLSHGFIVDYIILFTRSAINISDIMIFGGVVALLFHKKVDKNKKT